MDEVLEVVVGFCVVGSAVVTSEVEVVVEVFVVEVEVLFFGVSVGSSVESCAKDIPSKIHEVTISCISLHFVVYVISDSHRQPI